MFFPQKPLFSGKISYADAPGTTDLIHYTRDHRHLYVRQKGHGDAPQYIAGARRRPQR